MKFQQLLFSLLNEEPSQKQLQAINTLKEKLKEKWPRIAMRGNIDKYFNWFQKTKDTISTDNVAIKNFLYRFDGNHGYEKFQPEKPNNLPIIQNLKVITNYTENQIIDLYKEFQKTDVPDEDDNSEEIFKSKDRSPTEEKINASKNLWYGKTHLLYENDGFRIYDIPDQFTSINFGYYLNTYHSPPYSFSGSQWCTTWWRENNYYPSKRPNRYFYFIIDESKHPSVEKDEKISKFYLSALQVFKPGSGVKYALTDITNPGEPQFTKEELIKTYPKIVNVIDNLEFKPYDEDTELIINNVISKINEIEGDRFEYARMPRREKLLYIVNGGTLREPKSWEYTDKILRNMYINSSTAENFIERFNSPKIFKILSDSDLKTLDHRINIVLPGKGIGIIKRAIIGNSYSPDERHSIINPKISLYRHKITNKFGLFNEETIDWVEKDGIKYESNYKWTGKDTFLDENDEPYLVEIYTINGVEDDKSFYCVFPTDRESINGYFMTRNSWLKLKEKIEELMGIDVKYNPDDESDIKEYGGI